ncbi:hypothetical protein NQ318_008385 [Aromia moschata]|uniref:DUF5641 domain-containing protein n=1 Tax=Aromia moschata TaxID=1265417 RepID=A0AAV8YJ89_9CUCU|nr:hypothetical protein NQ318_008385 [Aromia moschata]
MRALFFGSDLQAYHKKWATYLHQGSQQPVRSICGVDFAGPYQIKDGKFRNQCHAIEGTHLFRYEHFQRIIHHFSKCWSHDYLHLLQQRTKWRFVKHVPALDGSIVLLKEDNTPPQAWPMGRIIDVHSGSDGLLRVVSVKTRHGVVKRAVVKVCLLPVE